MFVILTSKTGQFRTELAHGMHARETYDYRCCGEMRARFVIAELHDAAKIRVVDETPPETTCEVPTKLLTKFATLDQARDELSQLTRFGTIDTTLEKIA
jgi:hypothetical protein